MSTDSDSAFPRFFSNLSIESVRVTDAPCDLLTFIGVVQTLRLGILPIKWRAVRQPTGVGATGRINVASMDIDTSFAFKCVSDEQKDRVAQQEQHMTEEKIMQAFINEITILGHPSIRNHPNIVELEGVCWDVKSDGKVWPVLVFEKTQHGDLYDFAMRPTGRDLSFAQRLKFCIDIGVAIKDMHSNGR